MIITTIIIISVVITGILITMATTIRTRIGTVTIIAAIMIMTRQVGINNVLDVVDPTTGLQGGLDKRHAQHGALSAIIADISIISVEFASGMAIYKEWQ